mmetsp:Transcript_32707/g.76377  ORF Transcript_32707/g.76377 Transcript_32707/m.76377 type:complete len:229 (-) Transcript_32707:302-988(-)
MADRILFRASRWNFWSSSRQPFALDCAVSSGTRSCCERPLRTRVFTIGSGRRFRRRATSSVLFSMARTRQTFHRFMQRDCSFPGVSRAFASFMGHPMATAFTLRRHRTLGWPSDSAGVPQGRSWCVACWTMQFRLPGSISSGTTTSRQSRNMLVTWEMPSWSSMKVGSFRSLKPGTQGSTAQSPWLRPLLCLRQRCSLGFRPRCLRRRSTRVGQRPGFGRSQRRGRKE